MTAARTGAATGQIQHESQAGFMGEQGNLMFIYAKGIATTEVLAKAFEIHRSLSRRYPNGYANLLVTRASAPMPSREARDAFEQMDREFGGSLLASAMVIEGDGLLANTMRIVMRSMSLAFSRRYPMQYFAEPDEALHWLETQCGSEQHFDRSRVMRLLSSSQQSAPAKVA